MTEEKGEKYFAVVFYTNYRKENEWFLYSLYESSEKAIAFANEWSIPDNRRRKGYEREPEVNPMEVQRVLLDQDCDFSGEDYEKRGNPKSIQQHVKRFKSQEDYDLCLGMAEKHHKFRDSVPWKGISWPPRIAVVEVGVRSNWKSETHTLSKS